MLTILNSQNRLNKVSINGYHNVVLIELLLVYRKLLINKEKYIKKFKETYYELREVIVMLCYLHLQANIDSIKDNVSKDKYIDISSYSNNILNNVLLSLQNRNVIQNDNYKLKHDLATSYYKDNKPKLKQLSLVRQINKTKLLEEIKTNHNVIYELSSMFGWIYGLGDKRRIDKIRKIGDLYGMLVYISDNFANIDNDLNNLYDNSTYNFVINYGLQASYELYLEKKQLFVENLLKIELSSNTINELKQMLDTKVDDIINKSCPDLRSTYSSIKT